LIGGGHMMEQGKRKSKEKKETNVEEISLWDYIGMITTSKKIPEFDENFERVYSPFVVNRFFSNLGDYSTVLANQINKTPGLGKREHFIFLHSVVRKGKTRGKWEKRKKDEKLEILSEVYKCSVEKAKAFADLITEKQMESIQEVLYKGGAEKASKKKQTKSETSK
jgi:hypothetical protein